MGKILSQKVRRTGSVPGMEITEICTTTRGQPRAPHPDLSPAVYRPLFEKTSICGEPGSARLHGPCGSNLTSMTSPVSWKAGSNCPMPDPRNRAISQDRMAPSDFYRLDRTVCCYLSFHPHAVAKHHGAAQCSDSAPESWSRLFTGLRRDFAPKRVMERKTPRRQEVAFRPRPAASRGASY
jgi:hypothetical protein